MPAVSQAQQAFMGAELTRARAGQSHIVPERVAYEFAKIKRKSLPKRISKKRK
jgi:hypothetical protein